MKWVIKSLVTGKFVASKILTVHNPEFARVFNSEKQAKAYIKRNELEKADFIVCDYEQMRIERGERDFSSDLKVTRFSDYDYFKKS